MATMDMPAVSECTATGCSYNHDGCHAFAITVGGSGSSAGCGTFVPLQQKGGLDRVVAQVGACSRADCAHNKDLECSASGVRIGGDSDVANCLTYEPA